MLGEARFAEHVLDGEGASGDIGGVLEQARIARHQRRRREAENLPKGEIPRHDGEHDADGNVTKLLLALPSAGSGARNIAALSAK